MSEKAHFFVIMTNCTAENLSLEQAASWRSIIDWAWSKGIGAGSTTPLPDKFFRNGVLVAEDLWDTAWRFHHSRRAGIEKIDEELLRTFPQPWESHS